MVPRLVHTAELDATERDAIRALLDDVFGAELTDDDYEHCLGGLHARVWDGGALIGHASLVQRRLVNDGRSLRVGYVEGVAVAAPHRRRGHGAAMMRELERVIARAYDLGALGTSDEGLAFYLSRGWRPWPGTISVIFSDGIVRTPDDDGAVLVLDGMSGVPAGGDLACFWRNGDAW